MDDWGRLQRERLELRTAIEREHDPEAREELARRLEVNRLAVDEIERRQGGSRALATALDSVPVDDEGRVILDELDLELVRLGQDLNLTAFDFVLPYDDGRDSGASDSGDDHGGAVDLLPTVPAFDPGDGADRAGDGADEVSAESSEPVDDEVGPDDEAGKGSTPESPPEVLAEVSSERSQVLAEVSSEPTTPASDLVADAVVTSNGPLGHPEPVEGRRGAHDLAGDSNVDDLLDELIGPAEQRPAKWSVVPAVVGVLLAVVVVGFSWAVWSNRGGDTTNDSAREVEKVRTVLVALGLSDVDVTVEGSTVFVNGEVPDPITRANAVNAANSLLDDHVLDAAGLTVAEAAAEPVTTADPTAAEASGGRAAAGAPGAAPAGGNVAGQRLQQELDRLVTTTPVVFGTGQTQLSELQRRVLNSVVALLQVYPEQRLRVIGLPDADGSDEGNAAPTTARAEAVVAYLTESGIAPSRLEADARAEPTSDDSGAVVGLERRVVFQVIG